jgi:hypothetical protein
MKTSKKMMRSFILVAILLVSIPYAANVKALVEEDPQFVNDTTQFSLFRGVITDSKNNEPLVFATLSIEGTNVATVCNSQGQFSFKVPKNLLNRNFLVSYIGYEKKTMPIAQLKPEGNRIRLNMTTVSLVEVSVFPNDPYYIIKSVMNRRNKNYMDVSTEMTAFYRETIKKGWTYVSLSEAVVNVFKYPYNSSREDQVRLAIGRKSVDYDKLDTLVFKLQGGPLNAVMLDVMKDPYSLFGPEQIDYYDFVISNVTRVDNRYIYVIGFKQKENVKEPLFYGKLYIDTESFAITSASFNMNIEDKEEAARMFIKRKPAGARVYPTEASYLVNYREKDGKWFYGYSRGQVSFKVNWNKKMFNTNYYTTLEMAVTDWAPADEKSFKASDRLGLNVIMEEAVSGFSNENFWGDYNVIEPEQPIESAIKRIQKRLEDLK